MNSKQRNGPDRPLPACSAEWESLRPRFPAQPYLRTRMHKETSEVPAIEHLHLRARKSRAAPQVGQGNDPCFTLLGPVLRVIIQLANTRGASSVLTRADAACVSAWGAAHWRMAGLWSVGCLGTGVGVMGIPEVSDELDLRICANSSCDGYIAPSREQGVQLRFGLFASQVSLWSSTGPHLEHVVPSCLSATPLSHQSSFPVSSYPPVTDTSSQPCLFPARLLPAPKTKCPVHHRRQQPSSQSPQPTPPRATNPNLMSQDPGSGH
jgi:hypothetical protein